MRREYGKTMFHQEYTYLTCIITNGTQAILSDYYPKQNTSLEADMNLMNSDGKPYPFACYDSSGVRGYLIGCETPYMSMGYDRVAFINTYYNFPLNSRNTIKTMFSNGQQIMYLNGNPVKTTSYSGNFTVSVPLGIFALNRGTRFDQYSKMKLYGCKIWDGSTLVRDYKPVMRNSDGKVGLLDEVNNVFFTDVNNRNFQYEL